MVIIYKLNEISTKHKQNGDEKSLGGKDFLSMYHESEVSEEFCVSYNYISYTKSLLVCAVEVQVWLIEYDWQVQKQF